MCGQKPSWAWPSCESHYKFVTTDNFYDFAWEAGYSPHGPVHIWLGGLGGACNMWNHSEYPFSTLSDQVFTEVVSNAFVLLKEAWRLKMVEMPSSCALDDLTESDMKGLLAGEKTSSCQWTCKLHSLGVTPFQDLIKQSGFSTRTALDSMEEGDIKALVQKMFCSESYWPGDHLEAASPVEASFWPIHPTLDRLLQFKLQFYPFEGTLGKWENPNGETSLCSFPTTTDCEGHHPGDATSFQQVTQNDDGTFITTYLTNEQVVEAASPSNYKLPYVYDTFEWPHCASEGIKFRE